MTLDGAKASLVLELDLIPLEASNRPGRPLLPTHLTIHNTDNPRPGADARAHARYVKGADARNRHVSWHYSVDDQRVVQHLPDREIGWHAGARGNVRSLGIEICQHEGIDQAAANDRAARLVALLMVTYGIPSTAIVPHKHWTGKQCPRLLLAAPGGFQAFVDQAVSHVAAIDRDGTEE